MIDKVMEMSWDEFYEDYDLEDILCEACMTYEDMSELFRELLVYYAGKFDDKAMELIAEMMREYILDTM